MFHKFISLDLKKYNGLKDNSNYKLPAILVLKVGEGREKGTERETEAKMHCNWVHINS